jgi:hypothetical protein
MRRLLLIALFLVACAPRSEIIEDPIFEENFIQYGPEGKTEIIQDPLFEGNYLIFPEKKWQETENPTDSKY